MPENARMLVVQCRALCRPGWIGGRIGPSRAEPSHIHRLLAGMPQRPVRPWLSWAGLGLAGFRSLYSQAFMRSLHAEAAGGLGGPRPGPAGLIVASVEAWVPSLPPPSSQPAPAPPVWVLESRVPPASRGRGRVVRRMATGDRCGCCEVVREAECSSSSRCGGAGVVVGIGSRDCRCCGGELGLSQRFVYYHPWQAGEGGCSGPRPCPLLLLLPPLDPRVLLRCLLRLLLLQPRPSGASPRGAERTGCGPCAGASSWASSWACSTASACGTLRPRWAEAG